MAAFSTPQANRAILALRARSGGRSRALARLPACRPPAPGPAFVPSPSESHLMTTLHQPAEIEDLKALPAAGLSRSQIGKRLNMTRSTICGLVHRMRARGIELPPTPTRTVLRAAPRRIPGSGKRRARPRAAEDGCRAVARDRRERLPLARQRRKDRNAVLRRWSQWQLASVVLPASCNALDQDRVPAIATSENCG